MRYINLRFTYLLYFLYVCALTDIFLVLTNAVLKPVHTHTVAQKCDNLSQKSATVSEFRRCLAVFVALFCDSVDRALMK